VNAQILLADEWLVAADKPAGLLTIPGRRAEGASLWRLLEEELGQKLYAVHRLDRDTSGVVVFARSAKSHRVLNQAFEHRQVEKHYRARVFPAPSELQSTLRSELVPARRGFMRVARPGERGQEAVTELRTLGVLPSGDAIVDLQPHTGRTHQLRLQLAEMGSPIVGEPHYRKLDGAVPRLAQRLWLHALSLKLGHPETGEPIELVAPLPEGLIL
jgi:tRNA pseudouridine32 synthase/23S rRNA pseudouridine746 synthase/23S rRNA pseudouridine955/2504/2580 synthase